MKEKFLCVMAQYDEETEMKLAGIQKIMVEAGYIGRQSKHLKHHITLGVFDVSLEEKIADRIDEIIQSFHPFEIRLGSIGLFRTDVLFIAPVANTQLHQMHNALHHDFDEDLNWVPHTTMFIDESQKVLKAVELLSLHFEPITARIESISFYQFQPTRFIVEKSLDNPINK